ncbi:MAG: bifunctional folylpolyglutamate synthase/dihydrofolate synthase [Erysipelotrichaceae bacterium]|nr:bifunctional folylpolyglutamate synthase/dihydrofolate synthase [Erysipelotrichaceae bacterium]
MFNNIDECLEWITKRTRSTCGHSEFVEYLAEKGNPQYELKTIHVAGTNGKGSTTNYLRAVLQAAGYKTGSFTSPHLITHLDRIRINDENIDSDYFLDMCNRYQSEWEERRLSMFDIDMYISILYYLENNVDVAVYEVGMGGRLDATNVIDPLVCLITNIEMDHMEILGDTIAKIAFEKAGIVKPGKALLTFEKKEEALEVFRKTVRKQRGKLIKTAEPENVRVEDNHLVYDYKKHKDIELNTLASYQLLNSSLVIETVDYLNKNGLLNIPEEALRAGLLDQWKGRFETVSEDPHIIIDGAHNINGITALCRSLDNLNEDYIIVFSALKDKEYLKMLQALREKSEVIVTHFNSYRSASTAAELAQGQDVEVIEDYHKAIEKAVSTGKTVIITGSLYFISDVRAYLVKK